MNAERKKIKRARFFNIKLLHAGIKENVTDTNAKGLKKRKKRVRF